MKLLKNNIKPIIIFAVILAIVLHIGSCMRRAYYVPDYKRQDISAVLDKESKTEEDYKFLFNQTGLGKSAVDDILANDGRAEILEFAEQYFKEPRYEREWLFFPIVMAERKAELTKLAPLRRGDVLVSLSTHALGFRHGHAAMVLNGETGEIIEHFVIGETSTKSHALNFRHYPTLAILRYKDEKVALAAAAWAEERLMGISYNPLAGIIKKDKSDENPVSSSQCSHLVWQAYKAVGADVDGNGGLLMLPQDFLECDDFEIVQIYGLKPPKG